MIVNEVNVHHIAIFKPKDDSAIGRDGDRPESVKIAFEGMEPKAGNGHLLRAARLLQQQKNAGDSASVGLGQQPRVARFVVEP